MNLCRAGGASKLMPLLGGCMGAEGVECLVRVECGGAGGSEVEIGGGYVSLPLHLVRKVRNAPISG